MLIPASRFPTLPEGCPVRFRSANLPGTVREPVANGYRVEIANAAPMPGGVRDSTLVGPAHLDVDLTTPAAVRAFAPGLIAAVKERTRFTGPQRQPSAVWHTGFCRWILVDYLTDSDAVVAYEPTTTLILGSTPEECLLNGLKAAMDAAKDAQ